MPDLPDSFGTARQYPFWGFWIWRKSFFADAQTFIHILLGRD